MDDFFIQIDDATIRREREKARALRKQNWWQNRIAKGVCHYCRKTVPPKELTLDHLVPLARGGKSSKGNCVPSCKDCNNQKKNLLPLEWDEYLQKLRNE
ncbi:HNH endonuclease [Malonomonas rubra]|uniref:HNH endonuclease n=1 Tax=Malonomonas rubra TaxID=57040 RepID=UPI0026F0095D|nr:HNH endonuclease [Malonomonas rubra]